MGIDLSATFDAFPVDWSEGWVYVGGVNVSSSRGANQARVYRVHSHSRHTP